MKLKKKKNILYMTILLLFSSIFSFYNPMIICAAPKETEKEITNNINNVEFGIDENGIVMKDKDGNGRASTASRDSVWNKFFDKYHVFILGISGMATLTMLLLWIVQFTKLGTLASDPMARKKAITSLFLTGIATGLLGSVTTFTALFYYMFR